MLQRGFARSKYSAFMKKFAADLVKFIFGFVILAVLFESFKFAFAKFEINFPPSLAAMIALFILLRAKILPAKFVENACVIMTNNMMFYFVPFLVGIMSYKEMLRGKILSMGGALLVSVIITMGLTALAIQVPDLIKKFREKSSEKVSFNKED